MRALIILITLSITACNASKPSGTNQQLQNLAEEYRVNPNEAVLEVKVEGVEKQGEKYLTRVNVLRVVSIGFGFKQVDRGQILELDFSEKVKKDDVLFVVAQYYQQQSGNEYSLNKIFK